MNTVRVVRRLRHPFSFVEGENRRIFLSGAAESCVHGLGSLGLERERKSAGMELAKGEVLKIVFSGSQKDPSSKIVAWRMPFDVFPHGFTLILRFS